MSKDSKADNRWRFSYSVLLPVFLATACTMATVAIFISWTTARNDDDALSRQVSLVNHILSDQRNHVAEEQRDSAVWDEAFNAVNGERDMDFIQDNLGLGMHEFFGHDRAYVLDPRLRSIYAMRDGGTADPKAFEAARSTLQPLAERLREINWQGALSAYVNGASTTVPNITDVVLIEGQPAIVSLMPIVSDEPGTELAPGSEYIHITAEFLDAELAEELTELLMLEGARFSTADDKTTSETSQSLRNSVGEPVAYFIWVPDRPGDRLFKEIAPAVTAAVIIAGIIILILVLRLRRSTAALEAGRLAAQHLAYHDSLTGLGNRAKFEKSFAEAISKIKPDDSKVALLFLDLDRFKQVNDTLGHDAGDELIQEVATRLHPLVRDSDTIARLGGDEFAIVVCNVTDGDDVSALCNRIVAAIRQPFSLAAGQAFVGVSIGVSMATDHNDDMAELRREADIALYEAKAGGRDQFKMFEEHMNEVLQHRQAMEADLRAALIADDQLDVKFDPLVREDGAELIGVEAKITWMHPEQGDIPAEDFLPIAESTGLIEEIGAIILQRACEIGATTPGQLTAVRVYSQQLRNPQFFDSVFSTLEKNGMAPGDLELEVSEKMLTASEDIATATLRKFRQAGVRIALNNFGTGFTSLRLLQQFQVDRIKIDRSFIAELAQSPDPEAITHAVVWLARAIGVEVSADGVDTLEQKNFLARMGCMSFQGKLFSPEGQAEWLRTAKKYEKADAKAKTEGDDAQPLDDIEMWGTGTE